MGDKHARRIIDKKKQDLYNKFKNDQYIKPSTLYRQELDRISTDSFSSGIRDATDTSLNIFQKISSKLHFLWKTSYKKSSQFKKR